MLLSSQNKKQKNKLSTIFHKPRPPERLCEQDTHNMANQNPDYCACMFGHTPESNFSGLSFIIHWRVTPKSRASEKLAYILLFTSVLPHFIFQLHSLNATGAIAPSKPKRALQKECRKNPTEQIGAFTFPGSQSRNSGL